MWEIEALGHAVQGLIDTSSIPVIVASGKRDGWGVGGSVEM